MGIDRSPSAVYVISHRPGYWKWASFMGEQKEEMPAATKVKIGHTGLAMWKRRSCLATTHKIDSLDMRIDHERPFDTAREAKAAEKKLHAHFAKAALGQEWFRD